MEKLIPKGLPHLGLKLFSTIQTNIAHTKKKEGKIYNTRSRGVQPVIDLILRKL